MTNKFMALLFTAALTTLTVSACSTNDPSNMAPGKYEHSTSSTDANGTTTSTDRTTDVSVDSNGNKKAVVKSKTTQDPKGLFNKKTTESESTYEEK